MLSVEQTRVTTTSPAERMAAAAARSLPPRQQKLLRDVPGWEGVLMYDPQDLQQDRPLRWYRRLYSRRLRRWLVYELAAFSWNHLLGRIKRGHKCRPMFRRAIRFYHKGEHCQLACSQLTMRVITGFAIADPRHWVVDHISGDPMDDRPSNLQVISQSENIRRSERAREAARRNLLLARAKNRSNRKRL